VPEGGSGKGIAGGCAARHVQSQTHLCQPHRAWAWAWDLSAASSTQQTNIRAAVNERLLKLSASKDWNSVIVPAFGIDWAGLSVAAASMGTDYLVGIRSVAKTSAAWNQRAAAG